LTPAQVAAFVRTDCQDPELRDLARREADAMLSECLRDPTFRAAWDANLQDFADAIDQRLLQDIRRP
jgi:hypothetical protein